MPAAAPPVRRPELEALATLYAYPHAHLAEEAARIVATLAGDRPDAAEDLRPLAAFLATSDLAACEELHVRTFELNPVCALEIGWQIYGEQYARGTFLVRAQELSREAGLPPGTELADHLPNLLRVVARLEGPSTTRLASHFMLPAVECMAAKLDGTGNPYRGLLAATMRLLREDVTQEPAGATAVAGPEVDRE